MKIALTILLLPFASPAASLTGAIVDSLGASIAHAGVELDSGTKKYQARTDDAGVYKFSSLSAGQYTLTFTPEAYVTLTVKSIGLSEGEAKQIPEITISLYRCPPPPHREFVQMVPSLSFGELSGSVLPSAAGIDVVLTCRTFHPCGSTKTDSNGHFSFDMLSAGAYGLSFHRDGFFDQDATAYEYYVNAGVESVYAPLRLEECPNGNCAAKIQRILPSCE
jgi:hypothetical protein